MYLYFIEKIKPIQFYRLHEEQKSEISKQTKKTELNLFLKSEFRPSF